MAEDKKKPGLSKYKSVWPQVWALIVPRRGLLAIGFVLMVINRVSGLALPLATKPLIDRVIKQHHMELLTPLVLGVLGATIVQGITSFSLTQLLSKEAQRLIAEMRRQVQAHVSRLPVSYFDANKTGVLVSRIMTDVEGVRNLIGTGLVEFAGGLLTSVLSFIILIRLSAVMTLMAFGFVCVFMFVLNIAFGKLRPIFRERGKINADVTGRLTETLGGIRVVKGYHAEEREQGVFAKGVERLLDNVIKTLTGTSLMSLSSAVLMGVVGALVMWNGAHLIERGKLTEGGFFQYTALLAFLIAPAFQIVAIGTQITEALAGLERTREVLSTVAEDADPNRVEQLGAIEGDVRFENVHFEYEQGKEVLHGISLHAPPGTVTALVGSSGSGKSTIIGLISAFYQPTSGRILVDGVDLAHVSLYSYREQLGVVLQESFLFDGTIRENIAFSKPDATEEEVLRACRIARVDEFAERFADKYDTVVGERGVKLSGGQRQRISIARAILAEPRILILDEATSSLDSESEQMIQAGLRYLLEGRTTFVIAHRLSTIREADQILVVEDGLIVERGTHEELYAAHGRYRELYDKQHRLQENLFIAPGEELAAEKG
ncbi:MAG: ABC transporter ATP-binding protein [Acidobacteriales bacterium]|nr:ABC transporter ATP-binding protein [Terriglobales bacterium]